MTAHGTGPMPGEKAARYASMAATTSAVCALDAPGQPPAWKARPPSAVHATAAVAARQVPAALPCSGGAQKPHLRRSSRQSTRRQEGPQC